MAPLDALVDFRAKGTLSESGLGLKMAPGAGDVAMMALFPVLALPAPGANSSTVVAPAVENVLAASASGPFPRPQERLASLPVKVSHQVNGLLVGDAQAEGGRGVSGKAHQLCNGLGRGQVSRRLGVAAGDARRVRLHGETRPAASARLSTVATLATARLSTAMVLDKSPVRLACPGRNRGPWMRLC